MKPFPYLKNTLKLTALSALLGLNISGTAQAARKLTVYCSTQNVVCEKVTQAFEKKYNVETQFVRNSSGVVLGKIKTEKENPQADFWYGGTIEQHLQAAELGLYESYRSPLQKEIMPQFNALMDKRGNFTSIIYLMELGIGVNTKKLKELNLSTPKCYADLLKPEYKGLIQYPDPRVSGTGYSIISTLISLWGEEKAFDYLKKLESNLMQHTKTGLASHYLANGTVGVDLGFMLVYPREKKNGAPVEGIIPCEGVGYSLGGASIIKGARNLENAKLFMDFVLSAETQEIPWKESDSFQLPTNIHAKPAPGFTPASQLKLVDIDFIKFGSEQEGKKLTERWLENVLKRKE
ncbi:ABC transporter substrate-binding protein [Haemophilus influenzae]|nr:ABC transporter substrate-binding protein [Haemophilus influenzae]